MPTTSQQSLVPVSPSQVPTQEYILQRDGDRDLHFSGWLVGYSEGSKEIKETLTRGVTVAIYATEKNNLVIQACRWQALEGDRKDTCSVGVFTPGEPPFWDEQGVYHDPGVSGALAWLRRDAGGKFGSTSKEAWVQACGNWEKLEGEEVERV